MNTLPHLSSLRPPSEQLLNHKASFKQATSLLNKGITCTSIKEKNDFLTEVRDLWIPQQEEMDHINKQNKERKEELKLYQSRLTNAQNKFSQLKTNSSFYELAHEYRRKHSVFHMIDEIKKLETQINKLDPIPEHEKIEARINNFNFDNDKDFFKLRDGVLNRLEDLCYQSKKRMIIVERSQDHIEEISAEFGSLNNLIKLYEQLLEENKQLKQFEVHYQVDPLTKRRRFQEFSPLCSRVLYDSLVSAISNEITLTKSLLNNNFKCDYKSDGANFDEACNDAGFVLKPEEMSSADFQSTAVPNSCDDFSSPEKSLENAKTAVQMAKDVYVKLESEIPPPSKQHVETARTRAEKLNESNEKMIEKVAALRTIIDKSSVEVEDIAKKLNQALVERRKQYENYYNILAKYGNLTDSHIATDIDFYKNTKSLTTLLSSVSVLSNDLINIQDSSLKSYMGSELKRENESAIIQEVNSELELSPTENKPKRTIKSLKKLPKLQQEPIIRPLLLKEKVEALNGAALALETAGFAIGRENKCHRSVSAVLHKSLEHLSKGTAKNINEEGEYLTSTIRTMRVVSNAILVKGKEEIAIQTEGVPLMNNDAQTDDPTVRKKEEKTAKKGK